MSVQQDHGTILEFEILDDKKRMDLTSATTVFLRVARHNVISDNRFEKQCSIVDAVNGLCRVTLTREDLREAGTYFFQLTIRFADGTEFSTTVDSFPVKEKI